MIKLKGSSILEIIIATALISIAIIAALSLMNNSQKQNTYARDLAEATKYATQAAEWLRTERDRIGWGSIVSKVNQDALSTGSTNSVYCLNFLPNIEALDYKDFTDLIPETCADNDYIPSVPTNVFQRELSINTTNPDKLNITITVSWPWTKDTKHQAKIEMELAQWL